MRAVGTRCGLPAPLPLISHSRGTHHFVALPWPDRQWHRRGVRFRGRGRVWEQGRARWHRRAGIYDFFAAVSPSQGELGAPAENSLTFSRVLEQKGVSGATLCVGVRCRPLTRPERSKGMRSISRIIEDRVVVVMDPNEDMYK